MERIKSLIFFILTPFLKILPYLGKPESRITKKSVDDIINLARSGDILLSHEDYRLSNIFIRDYYDHAAIVGLEKTVIEAVGTGVRIVDLEEWLYKKDAVALIRVNCDELISKEAATKAATYVGKYYDTLFDFNEDKIYCSELIYHSYKAFIDDFMKAYIKHKTIIPDDFYDAAEKKEYFTLLKDSELNT
ncbi:MAG: YiiX/YebB-like N1pC/P60 family cysteine hydrolase [Pseudobdellovibrio sp.]